MTTGLVIGKFLPPHHGHKHLIDTAAAGVDHLDVLVCARPDQPIDGPTRARWLAEIHPGISVIVVDDDIPDESEPWARRTVEILGRPPDVVFTSEDYGPRFAALLGARHVSVDPDRRRYPVSGTAVRADPAAHWHLLEPCVRAHYARRVCIVGAESTGTTTLARALAEYFHTLWVPEYGRRYSEERAPGPWSTAEFVAIARHQQADEDAAARRSGPVLVCDTDALATAVWHERYLGQPSPEVEALAAARPYSLHVLTRDDIPFVQDGTRDGEHLRRWMTERFRQRLAERAEPWIEVGGNLDARVTAVVAALSS